MSNESPPLLPDAWDMAQQIHSDVLPGTAGRLLVERTARICDRFLRASGKTECRPAERDLSVTMDDDNRKDGPRCRPAGAVPADAPFLNLGSIELSWVGHDIWLAKHGGEAMQVSVQALRRALEELYDREF